MSLNRAKKVTRKNLQDKCTELNIHFTKHDTLVILQEKIDKHLNHSQIYTPIVKCTKKYNNIYHISDIHIRPLDRHDEYKIVFNNLYNFLKSEDSIDQSLIVITGDVFEEKDRLKSDTVVFVQDFLKDLSNIMPVIIIAGNHDIIENNPERIDNLYAVCYSLQNNNIHYLRESGVYIFGDISFVVSSLVDMKFIKIDEVDPNDNNIKIALYHGMLSGDSTRSRNIQDFRGYNYVLLGDIHERQIINKNIGYPGSLIQQNHGEELEIHGLLKWNLLNGTVKEYNIDNSYGFIRIKIENDSIIIPDKMPQNIYARFCITNKNVSYNKIEDLIKDFKTKYNVCSYDIEYPKLDSVIIEETNDFNIFNDEELLVDAFKSSTKTDDTNEIDKILQIHKKLKPIVNVKPDNYLSRTLTFLKLEFKNLFNYGNDKLNIIDFTKNLGITSICGENTIGKSNIINIIMFIIFNRLPNGGLLNNILNQNRSNGYFKLEMLLSGKTIILERNIVRKLTAISGTLKLYEDGKDLSKTTNEETRKKFTEITGIKEEDFILTNVFSNTIKNHSWFDLSDSLQISKFKEFFKIDHFDDFYNLIIDDLKILETNRKKMATEVNIINNDIVNNDDKQFKIDIENNTFELQNLYNKKDELQNEINNIRQTLKILQNERDVNSNTFDEKIINISSEVAEYENLKQKKIDSNDTTVDIDKYIEERTILCKEIKSISPTLDEQILKNDIQNLNNLLQNKNISVNSVDVLKYELNLKEKELVKIQDKIKYYGLCDSIEYDEMKYNKLLGSKLLNKPINDSLKDIDLKYLEQLIKENESSRINYDNNKHKDNDFNVLLHILNTLSKEKQKIIDNYIKPTKMIESIEYNEIGYNNLLNSFIPLRIIPNGYKIRGIDTHLLESLILDNKTLSSTFGTDNDVSIDVVKHILKDLKNKLELKTIEVSKYDQYISVEYNLQKYEELIKSIQTEKIIDSDKLIYVDYKELERLISDNEKINKSFDDETTDKQYIINGLNNRKVKIYGKNGKKIASIDDVICCKILEYIQKEALPSELIKEYNKNKERIDIINNDIKTNENIKECIKINEQIRKSNELINLQIKGMRKYLHTTELNELKSNSDYNSTLLKYKENCSLIDSINQDIVFNKKLEDDITYNKVTEMHNISVDTQIKGMNQFKYEKEIEYYTTEIYNVELVITYTKNNEIIKKIETDIQHNKKIEEDIAYNHQNDIHNTFVDSQIKSMEKYQLQKEEFNILEKIKELRFSIEDKINFNLLNEYTQELDILQNNIKLNKRILYIDERIQAYKLKTRFNYLKELIDNQKIIETQIENHKKEYSNKIYKINEEIAIKEVQLNDLNIELNDVVQKINELSIIKGQLLKTLEIINVKTEQLNDLKSKLQELEINISYKTIYKSLVDKKGIPYFLLSKKIKYITDHINEFLKNITNFSIEINLNNISTPEQSSKNKKSTIRNKIDVIIHKHGLQLEVSQLSGFERFILDLSMKRAITKHIYKSKCSFLSIDEGLDCIDENNFEKLDKVIHLLKQDYRNIVLITHIEKIRKYEDNTIYIRRNDMNSEIVN